MEDQLTSIKNANTKSAKWLRRLKKQSWEAEILVSTVSIFGTFQLFKIVEWLTNKFIDFLPPEQYMVGYYIVISALMAVSVLVSMFVIHFFLRAYWVGLVGLNSVFPDYGLEDSAYSKIYTKKILGILPKSEETIQKVDELCSVIFSVAFCFLLTYTYVTILASVYLFLYNMFSEFLPKMVLLIPVVIIAIILVLQTLMGMVALLKRFRNHSKIQTFYFHVVKIASLLTFGPLYKYLLQITMTFGSNYKKKKAMIGMLLVFFFSGAVLAVVMASNYNVGHLFLEEPIRKDVVYAAYYENQNENSNFLLTPELQLDIIDSKFVKIFIPLFSHETKNELQTCGEFEADEDMSDDENKALRRQFYMNCWMSYNQVFLNGKRITVDFTRHFHPRTDQYGLLGFIQSFEIENGKNILEVQKIAGKETTSEWVIPFHYFSKE